MSIADLALALGFALIGLGCGYGMGRRDGDKAATERCRQQEHAAYLRSEQRKFEQTFRDQPWQKG